MPRRNNRAINLHPAASDSPNTARSRLDAPLATLARGGGGEDIMRLRIHGLATRGSFARRSQDVCCAIPSMARICCCSPRGRRALLTLDNRAWHGRGYHVIKLPPNSYRPALCERYAAAPARRRLVQSFRGSFVVFSGRRRGLAIRTHRLTTYGAQLLRSGAATSGVLLILLPFWPMVRCGRHGSLIVR